MLTLAVGTSLRRAATATLNELTVGRWSRYVQFCELGADKAANENEIHFYAGQSADPIFAAADLTPAWLESTHPHVKRFKRDELLTATVAWLEKSSLSWQANFKKMKGRGVFAWGDVRQWRAQFAQVNPAIGVRVADALLAQLNVVAAADLRDWLHNGEASQFNAYFIGSDPHSGDHALVNLLASIIDGKTLFDAAKLPPLPDGASIRLFADGGWSGGESAKRLECVVTPCARKQAHVSANHKLHMRFGFLTDDAVDNLNKTIGKLRAQGQLGAAEFSCPEGHMLQTMRDKRPPGLAFQDPLVQAYVDSKNPEAMYELCRQIGMDISKRRPLGTHEIASTIAFEHSLPKAMLPLYIFGGEKVNAHDGSTFTWKPLLQSRHVQSPANSDSNHHCEKCSLNS